MRKLKTLLICLLGILTMQSMGQNAVNFIVNAPQNGLYYCNFWMLPTTYAGDSCASYDVLLNNKAIGQIVAIHGGWQSLGLDGVPRILLDKASWL